MSSGSGSGPTRSRSLGRWSDELAAACAEHGVHCAIGVNERELERPGTIYNALLLFGPDGPALPSTAS